MSDIVDRLNDAAMAIALYGDTPDLLNAARDEIKRLREALQAAAQTIDGTEFPDVVLKALAALAHARGDAEGTHP